MFQSRPSNKMMFGSLESALKPIRTLFMQPIIICHEAERRADQSSDANFSSQRSAEGPGFFAQKTSLSCWFRLGLQANDVLLAFDGETIGNDGTIRFRKHERVMYSWLVAAWQIVELAAPGRFQLNSTRWAIQAQKFFGEKAMLTVLREGRGESHQKKPWKIRRGKSHLIVQEKSWSWRFPACTRRQTASADLDCLWWKFWLCQGVYCGTWNDWINCLRTLSWVCSTRKLSMAGAPCPCTSLQQASARQSLMTIYSN